MTLVCTGTLRSLHVGKNIHAQKFKQVVMPPVNQHSIHTNLSTCKAVSEKRPYRDPEGEHDLQFMEISDDNGVPVYMMLPLDTAIAFKVNEKGYSMDCLSEYKARLTDLKNAGVKGVMIDIWWGLVENNGPLEYNWSGYTELMKMVKEVRLKVQAVMSFHQCGGNVGDSVMISLPKWVVEEMERNNDLCYSDQWGRHNYEYVSLGCDSLPVLKGRTPIQCYADFMQAFRDHFKSYIGSTIIEIQIGMGPCGELRYPSYPELNGTWKFPGIGAFQCYDKYMLESLKTAALSAGRPEWGHGGPTDAGGYNNWPHETVFFCEDGAGWNGAYGDFFLSWYSRILIEHADLILRNAGPIFSRDLGVRISVKIAGIHWHYGTMSHAAELTAGYYNTRLRNGYLPIARMLAQHGAVFNFTCLEMQDCEQSEDACCRPEALVRQVASAAKEAGVDLAGENALPRYDELGLEQIVNVAIRDAHTQMVAFTYLRMDSQLFEEQSWNRFVAFVGKMRKGKA